MGKPCHYLSFATSVDRHFVQQPIGNISHKLSVDWRSRDLLREAKAQAP